MGNQLCSPLIQHGLKEHIHLNKKGKHWTASWDVQCSRPSCTPTSVSRSFESTVESKQFGSRLQRSAGLPRFGGIDDRSLKNTPLLSGSHRSPLYLVLLLCAKTNSSVSNTSRIVAKSHKEVGGIYCKIRIYIYYMSKISHKTHSLNESNHAL